jgi:CHAT domain-containing protein
VRVKTKLILFSVFLILARFSFAQCGDDAQIWLNKLSAIESDDATPANKIPLLRSLIAAYDECGSRDSIYARIIHRLGDTYRLDGDFQRAIELTREAAAINKSESPGAQRSYVTHSYYNLALFHQLLNLSATALLYYDSCIETGMRFPKKRFIALMALEKKAFLHFQSGDYQRSIEAAAYGVGISRQEHDVEYESLLLVQQAQAEAELGMLDEAEKDLTTAMQNLNSAGLTQYLPNTYNVYANILGKRKRFAEATDYYNRAYAGNRKQGNIAQAARDLHDLALLYRNGMGERRKALATYERTIALAKESSDAYLLALTYNNVGQIYWIQGDHRKALGHYQQALHSLPIGFGDTDVTVNPPHASLTGVTNDYLVTALLWNKGEAWFDLFGATQDTVMLKHALNAYRAGNRMVDQMRWNQQGEQSRLYWRERTKAWYEKAVHASYLLNDPARAFYFMEKSRAVLLNDKLSELGAYVHLPEHVRREEMELRMNARRARQEYHAGTIHTGTWEAQRRLNQFIKTLEQQYPAYYRYKYDTTVFSLSDLQQRLVPNEQTWIESFSGKDVMYTLVITRDDVRFHCIALPDHEQHAKRIIELNASRVTINSSFAEFAALSNQYYAAVFAPLDVHTPRVTMSMDDYLIPFDLLLEDPTDRTSYLLKRFAFSYSYAATHTYRGEQNNVPAHTLLGIAPVSYGAQLALPKLSGSDASLEKIGSHISNSTLFSGSDATKTTFLRNLPRYDIVHIYSHANADSADSEPVVYFYDSALHVAELQAMREQLQTKAIFLFACNTGVGKQVRGEGVLSLARAFASAGIKSTISALWRIDNQASYTLAELFFEQLKKGEPADVALQSAKLRLAQASPDLELPYYWAGTIFIGDANLGFRDGGANSGIRTSITFVVYLTIGVVLTVVVYFIHRRIGGRVA